MSSIVSIPIGRVSENVERQRLRGAAKAATAALFAFFIGGFMFGFLRGQIFEKAADALILDVAGVGYEVETPLSTSCHLPPEGSQTELWIHTHVREDALRLFGFVSRFDKVVFETLLTVSSVGPKSALGLLGPLTGAELCEAILANDLKTLTSIPGVGMRTAERLVLELKTKAQKLLGSEYEKKTGTVDTSFNNKVSSSPFPSRRVIEDLQSALSNLGYKDAQVNSVIGEYEERGRKGEEFQIEVVLKESLRKLSGRKLTSFS